MWMWIINKWFIVISFQIITLSLLNDYFPSIIDGLVEDSVEDPVVDNGSRSLVELFLLLLIHLRRGGGSDEWAYVMSHTAYQSWFSPR